MITRVLFYLEPVTYVNSPLRLGGWWSFFSSFAQRSSGYFTSQIAAAPAICDLGSTAFSEVWHLDQIEFLRSSNFNRSTYSQDLCQGLGYRNQPLLNTLKQIKRAFSPDIVISVTDNRYLKKVFGQDKVMFMELGPLPRSNMKPSVYVDPYGHQINSALDKFVVAKWNDISLDGFSDIWRQRWVEPIQEAAQSSGLTPWMNEVREGRKVMLAALQPNDWITYEGLGVTLDPIPVLRKLADQTGAGWAILPQWHSSDTPPSDDLMDELVRSQPNILHVPVEFRIAQSEPLLMLVDGIASISSNVAATGAIMGKSLSILAKSKFHKLSISTPAGTTRYDLLAFFASRYCRTLDEFLHQDGAFAEHVMRLSHNPQWLFDSRGIEPSSLEAFLSLPAT